MDDHDKTSQTPTGGESRQDGGNNHHRGPDDHDEVVDGADDRRVAQERLDEETQLASRGEPTPHEQRTDAEHDGGGHDHGSHEGHGEGHGGMHEGHERLFRRRFLSRHFSQFQSSSTAKRYRSGLGSLSPRFRGASGSPPYSQ